jgi:signal transduction histidine kinase
LHDAAPLLAFTAAVAVSAMAYGWKAGLAAIVLSVVAGMALVFESWQDAADTVNIARVGVFVLASGLISVLTGQRDHAMSLYREMVKRRTAEARAGQYQKQLRRLAEQLVMAEQAERKRIASGLHDELAHLLAACRQRLSAWRMQADSRPAPGELEDMTRVMDQAIDYTRSLVSDLRPPVLDELGLGAALDWLAERFLALHGLQVELKEDGGEDRLDEHGRWGLFASTRELLFNVVKHAGVSSATVCVVHEPGKVRVVVTDAGRGFDARAIMEAASIAAESEGMGLFSVGERLDALGGGMKIDSAPGQGCRATLWVPMNPDDGKKP